MSSSGTNLESYLIPLEEINRATENFSQQRCIGGGGFGAVYKGQLSERWQNQTVAIKRLGRESHQGEPEFRNELAMISRFHHDNIISFIGYCDQGKEMLIVYDYAVNGSLDHHLQDPNKMRCITWMQRLKICVGAARGLGYLHSGLEEHNRIIHRDIKSGNILLDENLVAKVCDFGLSKLGPKNLPNTHMFTRVAGTQFYLDPTYQESRILRKESDVYSFGVVLFEMLSGMLVYSERTTEDNRSEILMTSVRRLNQDEADKLIDPDIKRQMHTRSFDLFKQIAYQCISFNFKDRPKMDKVIETLEEASNIQENFGPFIEFAMEDMMTFSYGKPVAAFTIYKCLLNWNYLEAERTTVFDQLIKLIMSAYEDTDKYTTMAFWLSNTSNLLFLIRKSLEVHGASSIASSVAQLLERVKTGLGCKLVEDNVDLKVVKDVEGKNPAFLFEQQLTTCVDKIYHIICDNMKKELQPLLANYIQAPGASIGKDSQLNGGQSILGFLNVLHNIFKENFVPPVMVQMIFTQIFSYIDDEILKSMLSSECRKYDNLENIEATLAELKQWCCEAGKEYAGSTWETLILTRQVITNVIAQYSRNDGQEPTYLHRNRQHQIEEWKKQYVFDCFTLYRNADKVINEKGEWHHKETSDGSRPIEILHKKSRIPYSIDDLSTSLQIKDFAKVKPVVEIANYGAFRLKIGHKHIMFGHGLE